MKILILVLALGFTACKSSNDKPDDGPNLPPVPTATPMPSPTPPPVLVCPENKAPTLKCYDWAPCAGLFASYDEAMAALVKNDAGGCSRIDGVVVKGGFGPCSECNTVGRVQMKSAKPSFEEILKLRDGKTKVELE